MTHQMNLNRRNWLLPALLLALFLPSVARAEYIITQITDNDTQDLSPDINNSMIVWGGHDGNDYEIFFFNGAETVQLTDNDIDDVRPVINNSGMIAWHAANGDNSEIYLYNGTEVVQITDNDTDDSQPVINDNGQIAWTGDDGNDSEIFLYDGTDTVQITDNDTHDYRPVINNNGQIAWYGHDGNDYEIFIAELSVETVPVHTVGTIMAEHRSMNRDRALFRISGMTGIGSAVKEAETGLTFQFGPEEDPIYSFTADRDDIRMTKKRLFSRDRDGNTVLCGFRREKCLIKIRRADFDLVRLDDLLPGEMTVRLQIGKTEYRNTGIWNQRDRKRSTVFRKKTMR